jgi:hypothetical protein
MAESEKKLQTLILGKLGSRSDIRLFRNTCGFGYTGKVLRNEKGVVILGNARPTTFGLCPGSSDLIGIQKILITPEMAGEHIGRFLSIEVKGAGGRISESQANWRQMVENMGGCGIIAREMEDVLCI